MDEKKLLKLLHDAEEYEDALDMLHPEDALDIHHSKSMLSSDAVQLESLGDSASKLAVVVGHTKRSPGAPGVEPISMHEYFWNHQLAQQIQSTANSKGVDCKIFFRDGIGISGAYRNVASWLPNACIELHFNAYNGRVKGTETLYGLYGESEKWADAVQNAMVTLYERAGAYDRGIKLRKTGERGGKNVNQLKEIPSCLIEPFFGDESSEAKLAKDYLIDLAAAIVVAHNGLFG